MSAGLPPVHSDIGPSTALELFEAAPCGYLLTRPDGMIARVNQTFLNWTGYPATALVGGKRFQELLTLPGAIFYETHFEPLLRMQGFVKEILLEFRCVNGETLPALVNSTLQPAVQGSPATILTTVFAARERASYERELLLERRKLEHLNAVIAGASDAIITMDNDLRVATWNRGAESMFGYTSEEAVGRDARTLIVGEEQLPHLEGELEKLRRGESVQYETTRYDKAGNPVTVSITATAQIEPPDEVVGFSAILRDVGMRIKLEQAKQANRDWELANRLAHEINNPLQAILNCLAMLSLERDSMYLPVAEQHLARIAQVVRDLVNVTRQ
jgi:PAS domain S-box-containing protein